MGCWCCGATQSRLASCAYPDIKGFSSRNLWYMKQWYLFYRGDTSKTEKLHQLGAELQYHENQNPVKLHQVGAEIASVNHIAEILDKGEMLPVFGIVPWKHHILIISKSKSIDEAFYYLQRTIDEGLSRAELDDMFSENHTTYLSFFLYIRGMFLSFFLWI